MATKEVQNQVLTAAQAVEEKKGENVAILEMDKASSAFTDYFVICSGTNPRQVQAIADEVELRLKRLGMYANNIEGYNQAEWVLLDYVDFVVHVFSENSRKFYDLERLWKSAKRMSPKELADAVSKRRPAVAKGEGKAAPAAARRTATKRAPAKRGISTRAAAKSAAKKSSAKKSPAKRKR